jgi:hypothetical protein
VAELTTDRETAVLVPVPEAERVVSPPRSRLDGAAALGVPAHVTVLFPFVPPASITPGVVEALAVAAAELAALVRRLRARGAVGTAVVAGGSVVTWQPLLARALEAQLWRPSEAEEPAARYRWPL